MNSRLVTAMLLSVFFLSGCFPSTRILEDIELIQTNGYDYVDKNTIKTTSQVPITQSGQTLITMSEEFTAKAHTSKDARRISLAESPKPFMNGRIGVVLYGKKLAEKGIYRATDTLQRDPSVGRDIFLAIVDGEAETLLKTKNSLNETPSLYLKELLTHTMKTEIPASTLHHFLYSYYGKRH